MEHFLVQVIIYRDFLLQVPRLLLITKSAYNLSCIPNLVTLEYIVTLHVAIQMMTIYCQSRKCC